MSNAIHLIDASTIRPSTYNPRQADPERLELVALSLRKLGWMLPIYSDANGEILSGHQRHYVATKMLGLTQIPVSYTKAFELDQRKAINIAFNRGTNDMPSGTVSTDLLTAIRESGVIELAATMPDVIETDPYPVTKATEEPLGPLLAKNSHRWTLHPRTVARSLAAKGISMPIVVDEDDNVVNGIGRLEHAASAGEKTINVVRVSGDTAVLAGKMLNLLTMDFDLHTRYSDELRYNSFRAPMTTRSVLGHGFTFAVTGETGFDMSKRGAPAKWIKVHGRSVLDFGAGHLHETDILRAAGVDVTPFEPFHVTGGSIDRLKSREMAVAMLDAVEAGKQWSSLFISSVLNSVPFESDRFHLVQILAALTGVNGTTYGCARSDKSSGWKLVLDPVATYNERANNHLNFKSDHEEGTIISDITNRPKVQKFHTPEEFRQLFRSGFRNVRVSHHQGNCCVVARLPHDVDPVKLGAALDFEFDLKYPDGERMGLAVRAREAFGKRLGINLSA